jgi:hypothetical protein
LSVPREPCVFFTDRDLGTRFPNIPTDAGLSVRRHSDLFPTDCPDDIWLEAIGRNYVTRIAARPKVREALKAEGLLKVAQAV